MLSKMGITRVSFVTSVLIVLYARKWLVDTEGSSNKAIPSHLLGHTAVFEEALIEEEAGYDLIRMLKDMKVFPTNTRELNFYDTDYEHIGEAQPISPNGTCRHPYLVPSSDGSQCVLANRIDIARHFLTTGGIDSLREPYEKMVSRLLSFGAYIFSLTEHPVVVNALFGDPKFIRLAKKVCPADEQHLDPFQLNFIIQVPGQTLATHVDGGYFWGATRFQFPQWLLAAMVFSGLFQSSFVHQVQVVGYLNSWKPDETTAGTLVFWDTPGDPKEVPPIPLAGSAVDGSKTVHATRVYRPYDEPPPINKEDDAELTYMGNDKWSVFVRGESVRNYTTNDLRISIVYRARCFKDEREAKIFQEHLRDPSQLMTLDHVLTTFGEDLAKRRIINQAEDALTMPRLELAIKLLDTYVSYPISTSVWVPVNYCMIPRLYPWTEPLMKALGLCG